MADDMEAVAVFVDTNLDTHMALDVLPDITVGEFKSHVERQHLRFFQGIGEIKVDALMVKRKSCFYRLSDSVPIKYASWRMDKTRFLRAEVRYIENSSNPKENMIPLDGGPCDQDKGNGKLGPHVADENVVENEEKWISTSMGEEPSEKSSEVISVTGIINKYFHSDDMDCVDSADLTSRVVGSEIQKHPKTPKCSISRMNQSLHYKPKTPTHVVRSRVGNRLVQASHSLGMNACRKNYAVALCRANEKLLDLNHNQGKNPREIFEMSDSDN